MISCYAWFNLAVTIPPTPGQPPGQVQPFGPGGEKLFEAVLSRGYKGGEANQKYLFFDFAKYVDYVSFLAWFAQMAAEDFKTTYFEGKTQEFVGDWLKKNNLSIFKSSLYLKAIFKFSKQMRVW